MSRLLFWLALAFLVMFAVRSKLRSMLQPPRDARPGPDPRGRAAAASNAAAKAKAEAETMLCCASCGVYYPASETVAAGGRDYCSRAHLPGAPQ